MAEDAVERAARARLQEPSTAPLDARPAGGEGVAHHDEEDMPRVALTRRRVILFAVFVLASIAFLYFVLPQIGGVKDAYKRVSDGDHAWLAAALAFQVASLASYVALFHGIHVPPGSPLTHGDSYLITMASLAATRLFAAGGAGGVALTAWALRRSGMERREVAERMIAFLVVLYGVYVVAMVACGIGLRVGIFPGEAPFGLTVVPAIIGGIALLLFAALALVPEDFEQRIERMAPRRPRLARWLRRFALAPASMRGGIRFALYKAIHPDWAMIGAVTWWAFNIGILWASFRAFGSSPPLAVLVQAFFVGMLANLLPIPGGIGGVDGGMIGALAAFGIPAGTAVLAVLSYRLFAFWLPTVPGVIAYFQLRRRVQAWRHRLSPA
jgi:putative heme transporter